MGYQTMGLDAFATVVYSTQDDTNEVTEQPQQYSNLDNNHTPSNEADFAYWRNFDHLQYWMERLFYQKGGTDENDFNGDYVELSLIDLEKLWQEANLDQLNLLHNPLFKEKDYLTYPEQLESKIFVDINNEQMDDSNVLYKENLDKLKIFILEAKEYIKQGNEVFYFSSW